MKDIKNNLLKQKEKQEYLDMQKNALEYEFRLFLKNVKDIDTLIKVDNKLNEVLKEFL